MLLFFFGLPGAGKTYAARVISCEFGLAFHDGDDDLPDAMRAAIAASQPITDEMRGEFFARLIAHVDVLRAEHPSLAVAQTFIKDRYRRQALDAFPEARFILVEAAAQVREARLSRRTTGSRLDPDYARRMAEMFEPPGIPHETIRNDQDGDPALIAQARALLGPAGGKSSS